MTGFLTTSPFMRVFGDELHATARASGLELEPIVLPDDEAGRIPPEDVARIELGYFSGDIFARNLARSFFAAAQGAENLRWLHLFNAGVDNPVFTRLLERGIRLTTSSGSSATPIAQTLITGLLMLSRGFPAWAEAQRRHEWARRLGSPPPDLSAQTLTVYGMGAIGSEIARLGQALGLHVIGIRRSPLKPGDPCHEMHTPDAFPAVLARTDWLALACPLTDETRRLMDADRLALLPRGAHVLNIARGEVVDEAAMVASLQSGHLAGAYLDVFEVEPLPAESPLWDIPNVIITPHNSSVAQGNDARAAAIFFHNLRAYTAGQPLQNEVFARA